MSPVSKPVVKRHQVRKTGKRRRRARPRHRGKQVRPGRRQAGVGVSGANHSELEWVDSELLLLLQADLEDGARVLVL